MTKKLYYKESGAWLEATGFHHKVGGIWEPATDVYYKEGGVWKQGFLGVDPVTGVTATNISVSESDSAASGTVSGSSTATITPSNAEQVTYTWVKVSGDTIFNTQNVTPDKRRFSATLFDGQSVSATYKVIATNPTGSAEDTFTIYLSYTETSEN